MTIRPTTEPRRPAELIIARHGEAWCNIEQTIGGLTSCRGLTPTGQIQAAFLAGRLAAEHHSPAHRIDAVCTSPLQRTRQTADIIAARLGLVPKVVDDLREPDYGTADGSPWADVVAAFGAAPALHPDTPVAPGAETWLAHLAHLARVRTALAGILDQHPAQRILIVAHGETVSAAHHHILDVEPGRMLSIGFACDQASLTTWRQQPISWFRPTDGWRWTLHRHNETSHLAGTNCEASQD